MDGDEEAITRKMRAAVGKKVVFHYPEPEGDRTGFLKDRVIVRSNPSSPGVPYWDVVDLVEFPGEPEPEWIRIGYYRKRDEHLVYASQTTITEPVAVWRRLLVQAAREKHWFRELLSDVMKELEAVT
jgi:hypothetical protein